MFGRILQPQILKNSYRNGITLQRWFSKGDNSCEQKEHMRKTIELINKNPECYATAITRDVFKAHPDYGKFFEKFAKCPEDLSKSKEFINKYMIGNIFVNFKKFYKEFEDDPCEAEKFAKDIGKCHVQYGVTAEHFWNFRKAALKSLEYNLGKEWNDEVKEAWKSTSKCMVIGLAKGLKCSKDEK